MKTTPEALRNLAISISKHDDPDIATALHWTADDIEHLTKLIENVFSSRLVTIKVIYPKKNNFRETIS